MTLHSGLLTVLDTDSDHQADPHRAALFINVHGPRSFVIEIQETGGGRVATTIKVVSIRITSGCSLWRGLWILVIVGICFLPWLRVVGQQMARVRADYWIEPFEIRQIDDVAKQLVVPAGERSAN